MTTGRDIGMYTDGIALTVHPKYYFAAVWAELGEFDASGLDKYEVADRLSLHEKKFVASKNSRLGARGNLFAFLGCEACEEW